MYLLKDFLAILGVFYIFRKLMRSVLEFAFNRVIAKLEKHDLEEKEDQERDEGK